MMKSFLIVLFYLTAHADIPSEPKMLENLCRKSLNSPDLGIFTKYSRYFGIIPSSGPIIYYPEEFKKLNFLDKETLNAFFLINQKNFNYEIDEILRKNNKMGVSPEYKDALILLKNLWQLKNQKLRQNTSGLSLYPCLSLFFQECNDKNCVKKSLFNVKRNLTSSTLAVNWNSPLYIKTLKDLQESFGFYGQITDWMIKPKFGSPEEASYFMLKDSPSPEDTIIKRFSLETQIYPKIAAYFPIDQKECLKSMYEKDNARIFAQSEYFKNECWQFENVHPLHLLKQLVLLIKSNTISAKTLVLANGSYFFHGTSSRLFSYGFYKKVLDKNDWMIKSRMLITGAKLLLGEAQLTQRDNNIAWVSTATLTGIQKAMAYAGVYKLPGKPLFYYGPNYPERSTISGLGFYFARNNWDEEKKKNDEETQLAGMTDQDQRFYFKENFPILFGFKIPIPFTTSKSGEHHLNEVMWFGGIKLGFLRLIVVPQKFKLRVQKFLVLRGDFSQVEVKGFEEFYQPVDLKYINEKISTFSAEAKRKKEWELVKQVHLKFSSGKNP